MSIFSMGRTFLEPGEQAHAEPWWSWNPARRRPLVTAPEAVHADPWWRWNPYKRPARVVESGRRAEHRVTPRRARRSGHPILAGMVFLVALGGASYGYLSYEAGSFAGGGALIDQKLAQWRVQVLGVAE